MPLTTDQQINRLMFTNRLLQDLNAQSKKDMDYLRSEVRKAIKLLHSDDGYGDAMKILYAISRSGGNKEGKDEDK